MKIQTICFSIAACGLIACSCKQEAPAEVPQRKGVTVGDPATMSAAQGAFEKRQAELTKKKAEKTEKPEKAK